MAVKTSCPRCNKRFSAPQDYLGKKVECPRCGERSVLRTPEEVREIAQREEEDRKRIDLIERREQRRRLHENAQPYYERFQTGVQRVRHYNPKAPSKFARLRSLSDLMVLAAYLAAVLALAAGGILVYLKIEGTIESLPLLLIALLGSVLLGVTSFCGLKYLGELAFLMADIGDQQNDVVQLLLDLRDNTDIEPMESAE